MTTPVNVFQPLWSFSPSAPLRGLSLAREKGLVLAWDRGQWLYLINRKGHREAQVPTPVPLTAACCAEDGSCCAAVGQGGEIWWLAPDLLPRWQRCLRQAAVAVALDPFGQYLAVADGGGGVHLFNRDGQCLWQTQMPRPLHHLTFVPEAPYVLGCADFGFIACLDLTGQIVWREGLVVHCGSLAVRGDGTCILLACFSEGLRRYDLHGSRKPSLTSCAPCRLVASSFDGRFLLVADQANRLLLLDDRGQLLAPYPLDGSAVALALGPLAEWAVIALSTGPILALRIKALRGL